ncbi:DUF6476 family protein [Tropicimonas sp. IMCC6043]|uniref:DUF6476 family protein n=1 Tax=Tropicimonas sp. IMCC6043 TaxID=2510645 RepID=UPI00101E181F|nr:DUF6476 family protein [Tropicimonas sp. IMCC6043]RYH08934.1 hypothetical protein EU800_14475 [Tropicimonas sp. IMCC6043]
MDDEKPLGETDTRNLRFLRLLVLVLTATMIAGMAVLVVLFATRFPGTPREALVPALPETLELPEGARVSAVTQARDFWVVVTESGEVLFYPAEGGAPVRRVRAPD